MGSMAKMFVRYEVDDRVVDYLDDLANKLKRKRGNRKIGAATITTEVITRLVLEHPEIISELVGLSEGTHSEQPPGLEASEQGRYEIRPLKRDIPLKHPPRRQQRTADKDDQTGEAEN
jgi:hypothetical protein